MSLDSHSKIWNSDEWVRLCWNLFRLYYFLWKNIYKKLYQGQRESSNMFYFIREIPIKNLIQSLDCATFVLVWAVIFKVCAASPSCYGKNKMQAKKNLSHQFEIDTNYLCYVCVIQHKHSSIKWLCPNFTHLNFENIGQYRSRLLNYHFPLTLKFVFYFTPLTPRSGGEHLKWYILDYYLKDTLCSILA